MSIYDRDFSKIDPSAFMSGSLEQAVNVLESALKEIATLKLEGEWKNEKYDELLTEWAQAMGWKEYFHSKNKDLLALLLECVPLLSCLPESTLLLRIAKYQEEYRE